jgi:hypothetical protein
MTDRTGVPGSRDPDAEEGLKARFGENVRLLRAHAYISQEELASRAAARGATKRPQRSRPRRSRRCCGD